MRLPSILSALVLCLGVSGCRMASDITHNVVFETCLFVDEVKGKVYYRLLAHAAWKEYLAGHAECGDSADFGKGFKLGYADYLENGGDGSSHPLPPLRYWKIRHETPEGRAATAAWLKGFREGAAAAKASGYRQLIIVPVGHGGAPPAGSPLPSPDGPLLGAAPAAPATPVEELPVPRSVPSAPPSKDGGGEKTPASAPLHPTSYCPSKPSGSAVEPGDAKGAVEAAGALAFPLSVVP